MIARYVYVAWLRRQLCGFLANARRAREIQQQTLLAKIRRNAESDFGREYGFGTIQSVADFRKRVPILTYEDHVPYISRVLHGQNEALFSPGARVMMFAMTSGTTGEPKRLPITEELFREYKRGWLIWAAGTYWDHRNLLHKKTLQLTSDWQQYHAPSGIPCGQISGLAATTRPWFARPSFLPPPITSQIHEPAAKHYTTLRFALATKRIGIIITANPSTLIDFAKRADQQSESLLRDIHDGTLSCEIPESVREALARRIARRDPSRARELARLAEQHGSLLPQHAWPALSVLAVWTGGSVGVFLPRLAELYGDTAVRDHGLSASEGRMTIPLTDRTPAGILDYCHHFFEFVPVEEHDQANPTVLESHELEVGRDYFILLTTSGGLYRYDIHDVVRCVGFEGQAPLVEFLNKGKNFANVTGEKLSEYQVIRAVEKSFEELQLPIDSFTLAPVLDETPGYVLLLERRAHQGRATELAARVQANLAAINEEYDSKCASGRLAHARIQDVPAGTWAAMRREKTAQRGNFEEYKHPCLVNDLHFAAKLSADRAASSKVGGVPSAPIGQSLIEPSRSS